jgi:hypothetical protein
MKKWRFIKILKQIKRIVNSCNTEKVIVGHLNKVNLLKTLPSVLQLGN